MRRDTLNSFQQQQQKNTTWLLQLNIPLFTCMCVVIIISLNRDGHPHPPTIAFDYFVVDKTTTKHFPYHTATCKVHTNAFSDKSVSTKVSPPIFYFAAKTEEI